MRVPLGAGAYSRTFARSPEIVLQNRFFETDPTNQTDSVSLVSRPGSTFEESFGDGPIRKQFNIPGLLAGDNFIVSALTLFRYDADGNTQTVTGVVADNGTPSMCGVKGAGYERVFIADGSALQYYGGQAYTATLTLTPGTVADDVVRVDETYYKFAAASLDTGAPDGTLASPWKVLVGVSNATALANLRKAINATGAAGTDYSTALTENVRVEANANTATTVAVRARVAGAPSPVVNLAVTPTGGADGLAWSSGTLVAGPHVLYGVPTPDDVGIISVTELGSFVVCVVANSQRVYFIRPGETTIDADDFFEAESETDDLLEAITVGDQAWLIGQKSIEPWYLNGDPDPDANPFSLVQGRPFSIGAIEGTIVKLANSVFIVGSDKIVYRIEGGPAVISNSGIAERVRKALKAEKDQA